VSAASGPDRAADTETGGVANARAGEAVVARVDFRACVLLDDAGALHDATVRGKLMGPKKSLGNAVVVGDLARWEEEGAGARVITGVAPRRNAFSRLAPGERGLEQVVAANLDQVVLVAAIVEPEFRAGFADRVLCQAEHAGLPARIVINKADLGGADEARAILDGYARAGYAGQAASAKTGEGLDHLLHACRGRRTLFVGHSGVGKSTLLNALVPSLDLLAGRVNAKTGKGRHTTTAAWLVRPEADLELIDTPGVRAFGLWGIGARDLDQAYPEFRRFLGECRFANCVHDAEPGCAVKEAVAAGAVAALRHASYLKLRAELAAEAGRA
jgi:ribosome biogenesis GTPase